MSPMSTQLSPPGPCRPQLCPVRPARARERESRQRKFANSERSAPDTRPYTQGRGHRGWGAQVRGPDIGQNPQPMVARAFPKMWNFSNGEIIPI